MAASMAAPSTLMDARQRVPPSRRLRLLLLLGSNARPSDAGAASAGVGAVVRRANVGRRRGRGGRRGRRDDARERRPRARWRAIPRFPSSCRRARVPRASPRRRADRDRRHLFLRRADCSRRTRAPYRRASASPARVARRCGRADNKRAIAAERRLAGALPDALRISPAAESAQREPSASRRNVTRRSWFGGLGVDL